MKKLFDWIGESEVRITLVAFFGTGLLLLVITIFFDPNFSFKNPPQLGLYNNPDFWENILVESHGMLLDLLIIGALIFWLQKRTEGAREKKRLIKTYTDQLESFREWYGEEAAFRVRYIIENLQSLGINDLDFSKLHLGKLKPDLLKVIVHKEKEFLFLREVNLSDLDLKEAYLDSADLYMAYLRNTNLQKANLQGANFNKARFWGANLSQTNLKNAFLQEAYLKDVDLQDSDLTYAILQKADLRGVNLNMARLEGADFRQANLRDVNLTNANLKDADLQEAKANTSQKEAFSKVMTSEQLNSIIWYDSQARKPMVKKKNSSEKSESEIHTGPKGGRYYLKNGKKVYLKKK